MKQDCILNHLTLNGVKGMEDVVSQVNGKQALLTQRLGAIVNLNLQLHNWYDALQPHAGFDVLLAYALSDVLQSHPVILAQSPKLEEHFGCPRNSEKYMECKKETTKP